MKNKPRNIELTYLTGFEAISIKSLMKRKYFLLMGNPVNPVNPVSKSKNALHLSRQVMLSKREFTPLFARYCHAFELKRGIEQVFLKNQAVLQDAKKAARRILSRVNSNITLSIRIVIETMKPVFACFCPFLHHSTGVYRAKMTCFFVDFFDFFMITRKNAQETQKLFLTAAILRTRPTLRKVEVSYG